MKTTGIEFEEFLAGYNHIYYFECIMFADGSLEAAIPSHVYKMCEIYDNSKSIMDIEKAIPIHVAPIEWLLRECNCVALWYNNILIDFRFQEFTESQKKNIAKLIDRGYINVSLDIIESYEKRKKQFDDYMATIDDGLRKKLLLRDNVESELEKI